MTRPDPAASAAADPVDAPLRSVRWCCRPFHEVSAATLYGVLALRSRVFVVEQQCIYQDPDGIDPQALLVWAALPLQAADVPAADVRAEDPADSSADSSAEVVATARLLAPGVRFEEPSIGRVCASPLHRRHGLGRKLMEFSIERARQHYPGVPIRISAQAYLQRFYESLGFVVASPPYLEDAIPHLQMRLAPD